MRLYVNAAVPAGKRRSVLRATRLLWRLTILLVLIFLLALLVLCALTTLALCGRTVCASAPSLGKRKKTKSNATTYFKFFMTYKF